MFRRVRGEKLNLETNRFDELVEEIKEREQWYKEMKELGEGNKYKLLIEQQIQERVREMNKLGLYNSAKQKPSKLSHKSSK